MKVLASGDFSRRGPFLEPGLTLTSMIMGFLVLIDGLRPRLVFFLDEFCELRALLGLFYYIIFWGILYFFARMWYLLFYKYLEGERLDGCAFYGEWVYCQQG